MQSFAGKSWASQELELHSLSQLRFLLGRINESLFLFSDALYQAAMDPATPQGSFSHTEGKILLSITTTKGVEMSNYFYNRITASERRETSL